MSTTITMPQLGESVAEGTIGKWLKAQGERIERDEPLVEIITDKVNAEIPSPVAGVIERIVVPEGQTVPVGAELVVIGDGSSLKEVVAGVGEAEPAAAGQEDGASPAAATAELAERVETGATRGDGEAAPKRASPLVRKLAREHEVDLSLVRGSGLGGRVTKNDILAYIEGRGQVAAPAAGPATAARPAAPAAPAPAPRPGVQVAPDEELVPLSPMRRAIAEHMARSVQTAPHAWAMMEVDATALVKLRESLLGPWQAREGFELTYLPFFVKAVVAALRENPPLNARWTEQGVVLKKRISIGIAVAVPDGLVVPVIPDADQKSIAGLAHGIRDLAGRARAGRLSLDDIQGGTFTVNNTGALGSIASGPIINQPQAGIITMEAIVKRPVVVAEDAIAIRSMLNTCLSFDHRVTDGAEALRFLHSVKRWVEAYGPDTPIY